MLDGEVVHRRFDLPPVPGFTGPRGEHGRRNVALEGDEVGGDRGRRRCRWLGRQEDAAGDHRAAGQRRRAAPPGRIARTTPR